MSPLAQLAADLRAARRPSLAWCVEHAPDGDLDAALARLWAAADDAEPMLWICHALGVSDGTALGETQRHGTHAWDAGSEIHAAGNRWTMLGCCLAVYRRHRPAPSLAAFVNAQEAARVA